jgi:RNA polymerase sigma-70 factor (ECF subfamily)
MRAKKTMAQTAEAKLVTQALNGRQEAFRQLVETYQDRLHAFIWRMIRNHHEAEDLCQAAFVKAYESLKSYNSKYAFSTWLFTIAYRLCLNHLRKRRPIATDIDDSRLSGGEGLDSAQAVANSEEAEYLRSQIWDAVDELTPAQKACVLLFYREGHSCQEIGDALEIPAVTVKSHLHRAREKLGIKLQARLAGHLSLLGQLVVRKQA